MDSPLYSLSHLLGMACTAVVLILLPASNPGLPFSTLPWLLAVAASGFACCALARLLSWQAITAGEIAQTLLATGLLAYGWLLAAFPSGMVDPDTGVLLALDADAWQAFGSVDQGRSISAMKGVSLLILLFLNSSYLAGARSGRIVLAAAITLSGLVAAIAGLCQQTEAARMALWQQPHVPVSVFGLFWYHGSAAAFLNLAWPAGAWLLLVLWRAPLKPLAKSGLLAVTAAAVVLQWVGVAVNASKMGHLLLAVEAFFLLAALYALHGRHQSLSGADLMRRALMAGAALLLVVGSAWVTGAAQSWLRWSSFSHRGFDDPARRHATQMALRMGTDAGWTGTGPGTFEAVSQHYSVLDPVLAEGRWRYAHNDYAQFFAEWGALGCLLLAALLAFPVWRVLRQTGKAFTHLESARLSFHRRAALGCFGAASLSVLIHALVDFPLQIAATQCLIATQGAILLAVSAPVRPGEYGRTKAKRQWAFH